MTKYTLQPYQGMWSRYTCPQCHRHKVFTRYINTLTQAPVADDVGRCGREVNCGYHYKPSEYFSKHGRPIDDAACSGNGSSGAHYRPLTIKDLEPSYLPKQVIKQTVKFYHSNHFVQYLAARFGKDIAVQQARLYLVGTSKHWPGACIFWQVDSAYRVRTGKIMLYNAQTGKRVKEPFNHIAWTHKVVGSKQLAVGSKNQMAGQLTAHRKPVTVNFNLRQCLFGEHLLKYHPAKPVAICESEKTAIIASIHYPQLLWLAAGSLQGLNVGKCKCLAGRTVILVPDVNAYEQWLTKASQLSAMLPDVVFKVMDHLQNNASPTQKTEGWDLADYL
jgi:hypothetical protein